MIFSNDFSSNSFSYIKIKIKQSIFNMNKKSFKMFFRSLLTKLGEVKTDKAVLTYDGDGELEVGMEVFVESGAEDAIEYMHPEDGEYIMEDGRTIVIKDGFVEEIKEAQAQEPTEPTEPTTEPTNENMAEPTEPTTEPVTEPMEPTEPTFDAEAAYNELLVEVQSLKAELQELKDRVNALLEVPAEEDAFSKQTKNEKTEHKGFMMKCNA